MVADGPLNELTAHPTVGYDQEPPRHLPRAASRTRWSAQLAPGPAHADVLDRRLPKRYSWYVRLAMFPDGHSWTGIVRCEASGQLPQGRGGAIADRTAAVLPLVASEPHIDPRAPQNLVPIGGARAASCATAWATAGLVYRALRRGRDGPGGIVSEEQVGRVLGSEHTSHERVPRGPRRRRLPAARRPGGRAHPGAEGRRGRAPTAWSPRPRPSTRARPYESDTHRIAELGIMPAAKVRTARVAVTRVDPEVWVSPDPGEPVERATGEERAKALYVDEMGRPLAGRASAATSCRSTSTSTSSTAARAATCRSAASAGSRRRPRSRCSSCAC